MCLSFKDHLISTFLLCTLFGLNIFGKFLRFTLSRPNVITMLYVMTANFCEVAVTFSGIKIKWFQKANVSYKSQKSMMIERVRTHCQLWCIKRSNIHIILNYLKLTWTLFREKTQFTTETPFGTGKSYYFSHLPLRTVHFK
jgi:hypothetical protein